VRFSQKFDVFFNIFAVIFYCPYLSIKYCDSFLGRNTLLCCSHFGWQFADFVYGNVDLSNGRPTLLSKHHGLVNSCDWHTMQFLSEIISIHDGVFNLQFSDGLTLSWQELNAIVLYLATDRQT